MATDDVHAALLDIDGTLLDSNDAQARAWVDALAAQGRPQPYDRVRPMIGKGGDKVLQELLGLAEDDPLAVAISDERRKRFQSRYLASLRPTRGARRLVERLQERGWKTVVATSAGEDELPALLQQADVDDLIAVATSSDDAESSKPDPDIVHAAIAKSGAHPSHALMIGDTPYDIAAARKAGVGTIALRCGGGWSDSDFEGALAIYDDPADLLARWPDSPLAEMRDGSVSRRRRW